MRPTSGGAFAGFTYGPVRLEEHSTPTPHKPFGINACNLIKPLVDRISLLKSIPSRNSDWRITTITTW
jgi:hypothetical protein